MSVDSVKYLFALLFILAFPALCHASGRDSAPFWIERLSSPDAPVLTAEEIRVFNRDMVRRIDQMADISAMGGEVSGDALRDWLLYDPLPGPDEPRFYPGGEPVEYRFFEKILRNMDMEGVLPINPVSFGIVIEPTDIRAFPSESVIIKRPGGFDTFQYSAIYPTEPVALLHRSRDNKWGFFQTRFVRGWMRLDKAAFADRAGVSPGDGPFIVVTGNRVSVFSDTGLNEELYRLPMGTALYLSGSGGGGFYAVRLPRKGTDGLEWTTGYIDRGAEVSEGFLPYTRRNAVTQAFKMLGEEYGWGGRGGLRDCSAFVRDIFASMGVFLPRNSRQQSMIGGTAPGMDGLIAHGEKEAALKAAEPSITLLGMDGHVMLYLGDLEGRPYVIHQIYGYMDVHGLNVINKVSVTGLDLGSGSNSGTLKERIRSVSEIRLPPFGGGKAAEGL